MRWGSSSRSPAEKLHILHFSLTEVSSKGSHCGSKRGRTKTHRSVKRTNTPAPRRPQGLLWKFIEDSHWNQHFDITFRICKKVFFGFRKVWRFWHNFLHMQVWHNFLHAHMFDTLLRRNMFDTLLRRNTFDTLLRWIESINPINEANQHLH